jgi:hypothetical protein
MQQTCSYDSWTGLAAMNAVVQVATNGLLEGQLYLALIQRVPVSCSV